MFFTNYAYFVPVLLSNLVIAKEFFIIIIMALAQFNYDPVYVNNRTIY